MRGYATNRSAFLLTNNTTKADKQVIHYAPAHNNHPDRKYGAPSRAKLAPLTA